MTLRDAFVRVVVLNEALDCGDIGEAREIASDLERDLAKELGADLHPHRCTCGERFPWPGLLDAHQRQLGHVLREAA